MRISATPFFDWPSGRSVAVLLDQSSNNNGFTFCLVFRAFNTKFLLFAAWMNEWLSRNCFCEFDMLMANAYMKRVRGQFVSCQNIIKLTFTNDTASVFLMDLSTGICNDFYLRLSRLLCRHLWQMFSIWFFDLFCCCMYLSERRVAVVSASLRAVEQFAFELSMFACLCSLVKCVLCMYMCMCVFFFQWLLL